MLLNVGVGWVRPPNPALWTALGVPVPAVYKGERRSRELRVGVVRIFGHILEKQQTVETCKACGNQIAKGVKKCPQCGKDQRSWFGRHKFLTGLGALVLIGVLVGIFGQGGSSEVAADGSVANTDTAAAAPAEPPMVVSADQLITDLEGNALKAETTYKDARVQVTGYVSNIDAQGDYFSVDNGDITFTGIQARITEDHLPQVMEFTQGQEVTFTGTVTDVGEVMGYSIDVETID